MSRCSELCVEYVVSSKNQTFILHVDEREVTGLCPALALCSGSLIHRNELYVQFMRPDTDQMQPVAVV